jgi:hypothetical protein
MTPETGAKMSDAAVVCVGEVLVDQLVAWVVALTGCQSGPLTLSTAPIWSVSLVKCISNMLHQRLLRVFTLLVDLATLARELDIHDVSKRLLRIFRNTNSSNFLSYPNQISISVLYPDRCVQVPRDRVGCGLLQGNDIR